MVSEAPQPEIRAHAILLGSATKALFTFAADGQPYSPARAEEMVNALAPLVADAIREAVAWNPSMEKRLRNGTFIAVCIQVAHDVGAMPEAEKPATALGNVAAFAAEVSTDVRGLYGLFCEAVSASLEGGR